MKLAAAERCEKAAEEARASAQAEMFSLQQLVAGVTSLLEKATNDMSRHRTMEWEYSLMLEDLWVRANRALDTVYKESVARPHAADDTGCLHFFTQVVTLLEDRTMQARQLVEEKSRGLLGRVFSRVFSYLLSLDPDYDSNAAIAPVPRVTQGDLASWVNDHVDDLVTEFSLEDGVDAPAAAEGGADGDDKDDDAGDSTSC